MILPAVGHAGASDEETNASKRQDAVYKGKIPGDPDSKIVLKVDGHLGRGPNDGDLSADVTQSCSDGTTDVGAAIMPIGARTKRRFRGFDEEFADNGDYSLEKAKIRVFKSGLARGWVYNWDDRKDPPDAGYPDLPDCSTDGRVHWRAERVR